ncbi:MAG: histidine kinase N-terminal 7TM domain-containing protein [Anaerovoracaceae bacterium]
MGNSRETVFSGILCIVLVLLAGAVRLAGYCYGTFSVNTAICALFTGAAFIWIYQLRRRILQPERRRYFVMIAVMIIFWVMIRTVKYELVWSSQAITRYLWYMYYVPQTFIALLMLFSVIYIGKPYDWKIDKRWKLMYIPAFMISAGVVTNDLHQQAFRFTERLDQWHDGPYHHGPVYFASVIWLAVMFAAILTVVFIRCAVRQNRKKIWIPMIPVAVGALYLVMFFIDQDNIFARVYRVPELVCFVFAAFLECLIDSRLIPSNDNYDRLWAVSTTGTGIMDRDGNVQYRSCNSQAVTLDQVKMAKEDTLLLNGGNTQLRSHAVNGGYGYWFKDVTEINRLNKELEDMGDLLNEENAMLKAENELAEKQSSIRQQNDLYKSINEGVRVQLDRLDALLKHPPQDEMEFERMMKYACILNTYVKRHSNMQLVFGKDGWLSSEELRLAVSESMEYVRLYGIKAHASFSGACEMGGRQILAAYEVYEAVLEMGMPDADALFVDIVSGSGNLTVRMEMNNPTALLPDQLWGDALAELGGSLKVEAEDSTEYIYLILPTGGGCR